MTARNRSAADFFLIPDPTLESSPKDNLKNGSKEPYAQCIHIAFMSKKSMKYYSSVLVVGSVSVIIYLST